VMNAALAIGGLISGGVVEAGQLWSFRILYLINGCSFLAAGWIMTHAVRRIPRSSSQSAAALPAGTASGRVARPSSGSSYLALLRNPGLLAVFTITFLLFMAGYGQLESGVPAVLVAKDGMSAGDISKVFVTDTVFAVVAQVTLMGIIKRLSRRASLAFAALSWSVFWTLVILTTRLHNAALELTLVCIGAAIASAGAAFFSAVVPALVHTAVDDTERGRANAIYGVSISIGYTLGPVAAGAFISHGMTGLFVLTVLAVTIIVGFLAVTLRFYAEVPSPEPIPCLEITADLSGESALPGLPAGCSVVTSTRAATAVRRDGGSQRPERRHRTAVHRRWA
jgi:MFS transporter, ACDE family, multidrug resistance protein